MSTFYHHSSVSSASQPFSKRLIPKTHIHGELLEQTHQKLECEKDVKSALIELFLGLRQRRLESEPQQWRQFILQCQRHPLAKLLHQDPFTWRAFSKPRGYAGDAEMLDYIYGREENWPPPPATPLGRQIFDFTTQAPASEGVRARRGFIADALDQLACQKVRPHVLSIGAGHLREANLSCAVRRRRLGRYVAMDADAFSLQEVEKCYGCFAVETAQATLRELLAGKLHLGEFDLVYATGLFDYLGASTGQRLVSRMFEMLRPGGSLILANFLPGIRDIGYMEAFMDWKLTYRTRQEIVELTAELRQDELGEITLFAEENQNIIFAQVRRAR